MRRHVRMGVTAFSVAGGVVAEASVAVVAAIPSIPLKPTWVYEAGTAVDGNALMFGMSTRWAAPSPETEYAVDGHHCE